MTDKEAIDRYLWLECRLEAMRAAIAKHGTHHPDMQSVVNEIALIEEQYGDLLPKGPEPRPDHRLKTTWRSATRAALRERDGDYCHWCKERMDFVKISSKNKEAATIEHLVPLSKGGSNELYNLALVHNRCNR